MMDSVVDWFGTEVKVKKIEGKQMEVAVRVNREAMRYWALQYARYVTLLSPEDLVKEVRNDLMEAAGRYEKAKNTRDKPTTHER